MTHVVVTRCTTLFHSLSLDASHVCLFVNDLIKKMSSSSESDFETNSFEKDETDQFSSENEFSDSLRERFSNSCPIISNQWMKKKMK